MSVMKLIVVFVWMRLWAYVNKNDNGKIILYSVICTLVAIMLVIVIIVMLVKMIRNSIKNHISNDNTDDILLVETSL